MNYDVIVIGAGLSGLTAASLLSKRGLKTAVIEHADRPGGICGSFKRGEVSFDQGAAMLYGFGEQGFNAHRFLFNCLEEPFQLVRHELLYTVRFGGRVIRFYPDVERFIEELSEVFPTQKKNIQKFYRRMKKCYTHAISESPNYTTPDETRLSEVIGKLLRHPLSYLRFLSYLNISAETLLKRYFTDPEILLFFNKLTSTYCYATLQEAPAILASVMFIDNHVGGSYYPVGSTLLLPGRLEKVIEENHGRFYYNCTVSKIRFSHNQAEGVLLENGAYLSAKHILYSGTVWNLYETLLPEAVTTSSEREWAAGQLPTYSSVVLYALVKSSVIPPDTCPVEMLADNPYAIDESEITVYLSSLDDHTLCPEGFHTLIAIGPSLRSWAKRNTADYEKQKEGEIHRIITALSRRFPLIREGLVSCELATPQTLEHFTLKNRGAAAGPKQMLGQHMFHRQSIRTRWDSLYVCGESTTMGTGTPTVTTSGIAAANAILRKLGLEPFVWKTGQKDYVRILHPPADIDSFLQEYPPDEADIVTLARRCFYCTEPSCCAKNRLDIPGIMRRVTCGNFVGAKRLAEEASDCLNDELFKVLEADCIQANTSQGSVAIKAVLTFLLN